MYAIVNISGQQFKVQKDKFIYAPKMEAVEGDSLTFDQVLLTTDNNGSVNVGTPTTGGTVTAKVLEHVKGDKIVVFKKKRRKGYKVRNGHRQQYTKLMIEEIA